MKKTYQSPLMVCEEFEANEYVAACYFKLTCDISGNLYVDDGDGVFDRNTDRFVGVNTACGETVDVELSDESDDWTQKGFIVSRDWSGKETVTPVYYFYAHHRYHVGTYGSKQVDPDRPNHS